MLEVGEVTVQIFVAQRRFCGPAAVPSSDPKNLGAIALGLRPSGLERACASVSKYGQLLAANGK